MTKNTFGTEKDSDMWHEDIRYKNGSVLNYTHQWEYEISKLWDGIHKREMTSVTYPENTSYRKIQTTNPVKNGQRM